MHRTRCSCPDGAVSSMMGTARDKHALVSTRVDSTAHHQNTTGSIDSHGGAFASAMQARAHQRPGTRTMSPQHHLLLLRACKHGATRCVELLVSARPVAAPHSAQGAASGSSAGQHQRQCLTCKHCLAATRMALRGGWGESRNIAFECAEGLLLLQHRDMCSKSNRSMPETCLAAAQRPASPYALTHACACTQEVRRSRSCRGRCPSPSARRSYWDPCRRRCVIGTAHSLRVPAACPHLVFVRGLYERLAVSCRQMCCTVTHHP